MSAANDQLSGSWPQLDSSSVKFFRQQGYLQLDRILSSNGLEDLCDIYNRIIEAAPEMRWGIDCASVNQLPGLLQIHRAELRFTELAEHPVYQGCRSAAAILLDAEVSEITAISRVYHKTESGPEVPWHQDEAYRDPEVDYRCVTVWIPLDGADEQRGCMQFLPGSHKKDVVVHRPRPFGAAGEPLLEACDIAHEKVVTCPVPRGGATLHHVRTLHTSMPNTTEHSRPVLAICCEAQGTPRQLTGTEDADWEALRNRWWAQLSVVFEGQFAGGVAEDRQSDDGDQ